MQDVWCSVVAPAVRPKLYQICYDTFKGNSQIPFEMIFVGNRPPEKPIADNFKYIYSEVKPSQCIEIGARESKGKYIIPTADDVKYSDGFLDKTYNQISNMDTNKYLLTFKAFCNDQKVPRDLKDYYQESFFRGVGSIPKAGYSGCFPRDVWMRLGGIDRRFIHAFFDLDLQLRCYEDGLNFKQAEDIYMREIIPDHNSMFASKKYKWSKWKSEKLCRRYRDYSKRLLDSLWVNSDGSVSTKRKLPVEPFDNKNIKEITQGRKGEWK